MKQLNKQTNVNTYELEIFIKNLEQKEKNYKLETQILFFCMLFVFYGLYTLIIQSTNTSFSSNSMEMSIVPPSSQFTNLRNANTQNLKQNDFTAPRKTNFIKTVFIKGQREVNKTLVFVIDSFDKNAKYYINFGDGTKRQVKSKKVAYSYDEAGTYKVSLQVTYQGKSEKIFSENLKIKTWAKMN
ncbi:MAG TPA: hypothetical protein ENK52_02250 [Saprospiraceae bacterium]|nr:hypothetical protein [Saprospiraceae bacterium]